MSNSQTKPVDPVLLAPILHTGPGYWFLIGALSAVVAWGLYAWVHQLLEGLGVTGMNRPIYWGLYISNFVFFIGISHAGTLISAILRLAGAEWRRPITRAAEAITVFALIIASTQILADMGRPDRLLNLLFSGRFQSPLLWDVMAVGMYFLGSIVYLYLPLIPDLAILRDQLPATTSAWRRWLYRVLALGWHGGFEQRRRLDKAIGIMAILIIPLAVSVHTVVSWIFGMTLQPMWHSTIFGPYFVVGAIYSGIATIIIALAVIRRAFHLGNYLKPLHFRYLGLLLLSLNVLWFYFTFAEYLTVGYGGMLHEMQVLSAKLSGEYRATFWSMIVVMAIAFVVLLLSLLRRNIIVGTVVASLLVDLGMWLERFTIVIPTESRPALLYSIGVYHPTWVEWSITAAALAGFALFFTLFVKLFPIISIWEVQEAPEAIPAAVERMRSYLPEVEFSGASEGES